MVDKTWEPINPSDIPHAHKGARGMSEGAIRWKEWDKAVEENGAIEVTAWAEDKYKNLAVARGALSGTAKNHNMKVVKREDRLFLVKKGE